MVAKAHGGTLVMRALFATGRVIEFVAREAHGSVSLAVPAPAGGPRVEPISVAGTLPELDRRADSVRAIAEAVAARPRPSPAARRRAGPGLRAAPGRSQL